MKKGAFIILVCMAFAVVAFVGTASWADKTKSGEVADEFVIKDSAFPKHSKPGVKLSHKKHHADYKIKCDDCHHVYKDGKNTWKEGDKVQKCNECHKNPSDKKVVKKKPKKGEVPNLYIAYHTNCRDCHKAAKKKTAPTKCASCHKK
ncbi:MAG: cytochrome c3 family protein [Desulfarculaceae bacterium]|jgi:hypothetical protein